MDFKHRVQAVQDMQPVPAFRFIQNLPGKHRELRPELCLMPDPAQPVMQRRAKMIQLCIQFIARFHGTARSQAKPA